MTSRLDAILTAAIELADERGLDAVSMRSVAEAVGVTPMALYPHVGSKAALLDGMQGKLLAGLLGGQRPGQAGQQADGTDCWQRLGALAWAARALSKQHPWIALLLFSRPAIEPDSMRAVEAIYQALLDAGVPEDEVPRLERLLSTFIIGFGASEAGGRFSAGDLDPRARRGQLPDRDLPAFHRRARWLDNPTDQDAEFAADLADLQRLIEAKARPGRDARAST